MPAACIVRRTGASPPDSDPEASELRSTKPRGRREHLDDGPMRWDEGVGGDEVECLWNGKK